MLIVSSFVIANPVSMNSAVSLKLNTKDINQNGKNDMLCFEGKTVVKKAEIFDVDGKNVKSIWSYLRPSLP